MMKRIVFLLIIAMTASVLSARAPLSSTKGTKKDRVEISAQDEDEVKALKKENKKNKKNNKKKKKKANKKKKKNNKKKNNKKKSASKGKSTKSTAKSATTDADATAAKEKKQKAQKNANAKAPAAPVKPTPAPVEKDTIREFSFADYAQVALDATQTLPADTIASFDMGSGESITLQATEGVKSIEIYNKNQYQMLNYILPAPARRVTFSVKGYYEGVYNIIVTTQSAKITQKLLIE